MTFVAIPGFLTRLVHVRQEAPGGNTLWEVVGVPNREWGEKDARWGTVREVEGGFVLGLVARVVTAGIQLIDGMDLVVNHFLVGLGGGGIVDNRCGRSRVSRGAASRDTGGSNRRRGIGDGG